MLYTIIITTLLTILYTDGIKTTPSVSITFDGITLKTWFDQSLWNKTRLTIVHHLNEFCKKDDNCDADYGAGNVHLLDTIQYGSSSIRLNITVDEPVPPLNMKLENISPSYNYTALLTGAVFQTKIDIERLYDNRSLYSSTHSHQNSYHSRTSRLLFVLLGIILVAFIFGLTVFFFQRIRRNSYSKLLKPTRAYPPTQEAPLTNSPSIFTSLQ